MSRRRSAGKHILGVEAKGGVAPHNDRLKETDYWRIPTNTSPFFLKLLDSPRP